MSDTESAPPAVVDTIEAEPASGSVPGAARPASTDPDATHREPAYAPGSDAAQPASAEGDAAPTAADSTADDAARDRLLKAIARFDDRLEESQRLLARQSEIATSLHAENQRLREGELTRAQLPLVRDIIRVQDDLRVMHDVPDESIAAADLDAVRRHLQIARESLVDALARNGIEEMDVEVAAPLDPRRHKVVKVTPTDEQAADRTVAEVLKSGFAWDDGTPIRAADVRVFKYSAPAPPDATPGPAADAGAQS